MHQEPSVSPSATTITSWGGGTAATMLDKQHRKLSPPLCTGIMTETDKFFLEEGTLEKT